MVGGGGGGGAVVVVTGPEGIELVVTGGVELVVVTGGGLVLLQPGMTLPEVIPNHSRSMVS